MLKGLFYLSAGSSRWGTGHLRRSVELVDILRKKGLHVDMVALVPDSNEMQKLSPFLKSYDKCIQSLNEIGSVDADGIVVDVHTAFQPKLFPWLQEQKHSVFALDWYCETGGVVVAKANLRGGVPALKYSIIRKEFHDAFLNHSGTSPEYDAVVVMGGGDNGGYLSKIFSLFTEDSLFLNKNIVIVVGPMVDGKLAELAGQSIGPVTILKTPDNIADIMANASVGITNGGTSLMEFTMLGVPTIIFPQSEEEDNFVKPFLENRCAVMGSLEPKEFAEQIMKLWENEMLRKSMTEKARELIDGQGAERITDLIFKTFFQEEYLRK